MDEQTTFEEEEFEEISLSDKIVGVLSEPAKLFSRLAKVPPRTSDWIIPLSVIILLAITTQYIVLQNPMLRQQAVNEQLDSVEEYFSGLVESDQMTQEQADQQLEAMEGRIEEQMDAGLIVGVISILIMSFVFFFIISGVFFLVAKFVLKGEGSYATGLSAYGMPGYIMALQLVATIVLVYTMEDIKAGTDIAKLMGYDTKEFTGYLLSYLDPFKIWYYIVMGIAFAKMYKSENTSKYVGVFIGSWVLFGLAFYGLAQAVPFLQFMIR